MKYFLFFAGLKNKFYKQYIKYNKYIKGLIISRFVKMIRYNVISMNSMPGIRNQI